MSEYAESATVMWPVNMPEVEDAHVTLLYLGEIGELNVTPMAIINVLGGMGLEAPGDVETTGVEEFGQEDKVWVYTLSDVLQEPREAIKAQLVAELGIKDASSFPDYRPHVTVGPATGEKPEAPPTVELLKPSLWWGDQHISF